MAEQTRTRTEKIVNGVNVEELFNSIETIKATPGAAKFRFHLDNKWLEGGHNRSIVKNFHGGGDEITRDKAFTIEADEPPALLGEDRAPNPVEFLLKALAACVTSSIVYHAAAKGIAIEQMECSVEGDLDIRGFLGLDKNVRNGYQQIRMNFRVKADLNDTELDELVQLGPTHSPVFDSLTKGVPVIVKAERLGTRVGTTAA
ncbi:MAG TPA: OsmC family protein [Terriglobales bacterium]|jgi:uncharacterized OsmC-like protein|nr:OsmC family protein [Terriglobales bacterium]